MTSYSVAAIILLFLAIKAVHGEYAQSATTLSSTGKPLVKRPVGRTYQTVVSVDAGAVRGLLAAIILIEVEQAIKRHLIDHPDLLPSQANITTIDDFDINLADYFDCMTGVSSGGWSVLYLASRGGQGAVRSVLEKPEVIAKYGVIPVGGAGALRVLFREFSDVVYPAETINMALGKPFDLTNPNAPGVNSPLYSLDGLEHTLQAFLGNATLENVDTSLIVQAFDLIRNLGVYFVQNKFRSPAVTSSAQLTARAGPQTAAANGARFASHLLFDEGKNYYLKDIGAATGAVPAAQPAKNVSQVGSDSVEFVMIDGISFLEGPGPLANAFVINENGFQNAETVAHLSIGTGKALQSFLKRANAGAADWLGDNVWLSLCIAAGTEALSGLTDYIYYSNPNTRPNQYLRVQASAPIETEEGIALSNGLNTAFLDIIEDIGGRTAQEYRESIYAFVSDFMFG